MGLCANVPSIALQDEPELVQASLWHTAAIHATSPADKLQAYQQAIQALKVQAYLCVA